MKVVMMKTNLGVSVGLLGSAVCFSALFGGYTPYVLLAGYILLFEENEWLRKTAVKAGVLMFLFSFLSSVIGLVPNALSLLGNLTGIFGVLWTATPVTSLVAAVNSALTIAEKFLFLTLGIKALVQGTRPIKTVDKIVEEHTL
jgi:hypothetical protein